MAKDTIVNFVLDETGSMQSIKQATINGVNEYFQMLRERKGRIYLTLTQFNSEKVEVVHAHVIMSKVPDLTDETYRPNNLTPLYDAVAKTIKATEERIAKRKTKPAVLCVIMSDGLENASKEWTRDGVFKLIEEKTAEGWTFAYLGANQDAYIVSESIGIARGSAMNFVATPAGVKGAMASVSQSTSDWMDTGSQPTSSFLEPEDESSSDETPEPA
jgi:hypothetical protein